MCASGECLLHGVSNLGHLLDAEEARIVKDQLPTGGAVRGSGPCVILGGDMNQRLDREQFNRLKVLVFGSRCTLWCCRLI